MLLSEGWAELKQTGKQNELVITYNVYWETAHTLPLPNVWWVIGTINKCKKSETRVYVRVNREA